MTPFGWIAKVVIGLMQSVYGITASVVSGTINTVVKGTFIVRQPGGVAGNDEVQISYAGNKATIENKDTTTGSAISVLEIKGPDYSGGTFTLILDSAGQLISTNSLGFRLGSSSAQMYLASGAIQAASTTQFKFSSDGNPAGGADTGLRRAAAGVVGTTNGSTGAGYLHSDRLSVINNAEGGTARLNIQTARDLVTLTGATTDTTTISAPAGCLLLGASFTVNTAVVDDAGDNTWSAAYVTGATTALATGSAAAQNTKVNKLVVPELATATTQIRFTPNGGSFSAGVIEVIAYYIDLTSLAN